MSCHSFAKIICIINHVNYNIYSMFPEIYTICPNECSTKMSNIVNKCQLTNIHLCSKYVPRVN